MASAVERLQEKWERITPRERGLVILLGATFVIVILASLGFMISDGLSEIEDKNANTRKALKALDDFRRTGAVQQGPEVVIPDEAEKLETYLERIAGQVGFEIPGTSPRTPVVRGKYKESSTRLEVRGLTIFQLKDFLQRVETDNRLVVVTSLHVKRNFREKEKLDVDLVVTTYSKAEKSETAEGEGNGG